MQWTPWRRVAVLHLCEDFPSLLAHAMDSSHSGWYGRRCSIGGVHVAGWPSPLSMAVPPAGGAVTEDNVATVVRVTGQLGGQERG